MTPDDPVAFRDRLETLSRDHGADAFGVAPVSSLRGMESGPIAGTGFLDRYETCIVIGLGYGSLGAGTTGADASVALERAALALCGEFEAAGRACLVVHTEDEFDADRRAGLLPLKALAKEAGLGWQGRSLLAVSPGLGPLHRVIAVLSDVAMPTDARVPNRCGPCRACVDACPTGALSLVDFEDHPDRREDVLDVEACLGDDGCVACIESCPRLPRERRADQHGVG